MIFIELHKTGKHIGLNDDKILINPEQVSAIENHKVYFRDFYFDVIETYDEIVERMRNYAEVRDRR